MALFSFHIVFVITVFIHPVFTANIFELCTTHEECPADASCKPNSCKGYVCLCDQGQGANYGYTGCKKVSFIGDPCTDTSNCPYLSYCNANKRCECMSSARATATKRIHCVLRYRRELGETCSQDSQCPRFSNCQNNTCVCVAGFRPKTDAEFWANPLALGECIADSFSLDMCGSVELGIPSALLVSSSSISSSGVETIIPASSTYISSLFLDASSSTIEVESTAITASETAGYTSSVVSDTDTSTVLLQSPAVSSVQSPETSEIPSAAVTTSELPETSMTINDISSSMAQITPTLTLQVDSSSFLVQQSTILPSPTVQTTSMELDASSVVPLDVSDGLISSFNTESSLPSKEISTVDTQSSLLDLVSLGESSLQDIMSSAIDVTVSAEILASLEESSSIESSQTFNTAPESSSVIQSLDSNSPAIAAVDSTYVDQATTSVLETSLISHGSTSIPATTASLTVSVPSTAAGAVQSSNSLTISITDATSHVTVTPTLSDIVSVSFVATASVPVTPLILASSSVASVNTLTPATSASTTLAINPSTTATITSTTAGIEASTTINPTIPTITPTTLVVNSATKTITALNSATTAISPTTATASATAGSNTATTAITPTTATVSATAGSNTATTAITPTTATASATAGSITATTAITSMTATASATAGSNTATTAITPTTTTVSATAGSNTATTAISPTTATKDILATVVPMSTIGVTPGKTAPSNNSQNEIPEVLIIVGTLSGLFFILIVGLLLAIFCKCGAFGIRRRRSSYSSESSSIESDDKLTIPRPFVNVSQPRYLIPQGTWTTHASHNEMPLYYSNSAYRTEL